MVVAFSSGVCTAVDIPAKSSAANPKRTMTKEFKKRVKRETGIIMSEKMIKNVVEEESWADSLRSKVKNTLYKLHTLCMAWTRMLVQIQQVAITQAMDVDHVKPGDRCTIDRSVPCRSSDQ